MNTEVDRRREHVTSESDVAVLSYDQDLISPADDSQISLVETTLQERLSAD
jgi:hypothetical protein